MKKSNKKVISMVAILLGVTFSLSSCVSNEDKVNEDISISEQTPDVNKDELTAEQEDAIQIGRTLVNQQLEKKAYTSPYGLRTLLKGEGFTDEEAIFVVEHIDIDWSEHAVGFVEIYLSTGEFSRDDLIGLLEYENFSTEDANLAVDSLNIN